MLKQASMFVVDIDGLQMGIEAPQNTAGSDGIVAKLHSSSCTPKNTLLDFWQARNALIL